MNDLSVIMYVSEFFDPDQLLKLIHGLHELGESLVEVSLAVDGILGFW